MRSRGPDDAGLFLQTRELPFVGLGHRRLSIVDLSDRGHQPMTTPDGSMTIVFNGEIFNFRELRQELRDTGRCDFRSESDTEVLLYALKEWGPEKCLGKIRGMYAFALYDKDDGKLTLVRDPLGVKPLYYYRGKNSFVFASEIKAILEAPFIRREINQESLYHYLTFANAPASSTFFDGIFKLPAGTYLTIDRNGRESCVRYWNPADFVPSETPLREEEYVEELRRLLRQSVERRMISDVPFGAFLSGGVDSSLNVALMAEALDRPVETFSVGIKGDDRNELEQARYASRIFGTNHHEIVIDDNDFTSFLPEMAYLQDEPLADPVCVPLYYLCKLARNSGTTVIQVGEGSDEIFAGYGTYHLFDKADRRVYRHYLGLPKAFRSMVFRLLKGRVSPELEDALVRARDGNPLFMGNAIAFWDQEKQRLLNPTFPFTESSAHLVTGMVGDARLTDSLSRIINLELVNRLPELLLMRVDKMSMANSIEARVPFLDEDVVEFALKIPSYFKHKNGEAKYILKQAARGIIPDDIIYRKKWGFCGSATTMLTEKLTQFARTRVLESPIISQYFRRAYVEGIFTRHKKQKRFNSFKIWTLLNLVLWHECWFENDFTRHNNQDTW